MRADLAVKAFGMIGGRNAVNGVHIDRRDYSAFAQIAEQRDFALRGGRDRSVAAAQQDVGLDPERQ